MTNFTMGELTRGDEPMVFDWIKAAKIIKERGAKNARAGLEGDWEETEKIILADGKLTTEPYQHLSSTWATPRLEIDGEIIPCFVMQGEQLDWDSDTFWPEEAKKILFGDIDPEKK